MSWSESFQNVDLGEILRLEPKNESTKTHQPHLDQFQGALAAAIELISSGAIGDPEEFKFNLNLSGHGNDGHIPSQSWTNDFTTIQVSQAVDDGV